MFKGLATFHWDEDAQKYRVKCFNFYLFPSHIPGVGSPDRVFSCQSSSIEFLLQHGFDFNMVFKQGIPFLRPDEEEKVKYHLVQKQTRRESFQSPQQGSMIFNTNSSSSDNFDQKTVEFIENICNLIQNFLSDQDKTELVLEPCNSYFRKVLYDTLPMKFPNQITLESRMNDKTRQRHMVVIRGNDETVKKERQKQMKAQEGENFQKAIGFSKVIKMLTDSKKIIIGHNMLLDVMYTVQHFVSDLPPTLDEFKALTQCAFPQILDTKLMSSLLPFKGLISSTTLSDLYACLQSSPFSPPSVEVPEMYDAESGRLHEAGYDAYITGCSFASMLHFLSSMQKKDKADDTPPLTLITPYINKIFLMKTFDLPYLNLAGPDLTPNRDHVFHVRFPSSWKTNDLRQLFSAFGNILVSWINDTSCFVGLHDKSQVENVKKSLMKSHSAEPSIYRLLTFQEYESSTHCSKPASTSWVRSQPSTSSDKSTNHGVVSRKRLSGKDRESHAVSSEELAAKKARPQGESPDGETSSEQSAMFEVPSQW